MPDLTEIAEDLLVTEERARALNLERTRLTVDHSLVLHRDSASAADVKAMIAHLEREGMPPEATLRVDGSDRHTRVYAQWCTEVDHA